MSKKKPTKHKATEERTTLLFFFFPKTEKTSEKSVSKEAVECAHTRRASKRARERETARETTREARRPSGYQSERSRETERRRTGRRFRRLLGRASNPSHWRVDLYTFFGGNVRVYAFWRSLYHLPFSLVSIYRFRNILWAHYSTCAIQAVSSWLHKLFCWFRIGLKCDA
jgi:hypothetical protein